MVALRGCSTLNVQIIIKDNLRRKPSTGSVNMIALSCRCSFSLLCAEELVSRMLVTVRHFIGLNTMKYCSSGWQLSGELNVAVALK